MKHFVKTAIQHPLISGSGIIIAGSVFGNVFNFLFNLYMSRNLPIADYGTLVSIVSLVLLATIPLSSVTPSIVSFSGKYFASGEIGMISLFYRKTLSYLLGFSVLLILLILLFSASIAQFFKINSSELVVYAGITVAIIYLGSLNSGLLQAKLSFKFISLSNFISSFAKFSVGLILIMLGYGVFGAVIAFLLSFLMPFLISFIPILSIFKESNHTKYKLPLREIFLYGVPSAVAIFGLNSLVSTDLLLVKHLLSPDKAGLYAGMSLVGRVIFFLTAPVGTVMYPLIVQKHAKNESYRNTLILSILLVFLPSLAVSIFYFLYPEFALTFFLKKTEYLAVSKYLGVFGIFIAIYSVISLLTYYFLSIKKSMVWLPLALSSIGQAVLIYFFHQSFLQIIIISLTISILLLSFLLIYFKKTH